MRFGHVLVAGATGAIGTEVVRELQARGVRVRSLVRDPDRLRVEPEEIFVGNLQNPRTLQMACDDVEAVVSCAGAPFRMLRPFRAGRDTFYDIDDAGNRNLLEEALSSSVKRFAYLSCYGGRVLGAIEYIRAHESFASALRTSGIDSVVVRTTVAFSRLEQLLQRALAKDHVSVVGTGEARTNPIHQADLASSLVDALEGHEQDVDVGGPEVLSLTEIAQIAAEVAGDARVSYTFTWIEQWKTALRRFYSRHNYDVSMHFLAESAVDVIAPVAGERTLRDHFREIIASQASS